ncbi:hypothetical protein PMZ80_001380 [Knufia obscura]|uniref:Uncharacterized protein n=1 Tax=Knufia obscura TaxID=1635080 RepID=A0ABR0S2Y4_9EURO|nr:hypothetical protein PMZ80_001380 [Knufia obscura]
MNRLTSNHNLNTFRNSPNSYPLQSEPSKKIPIPTMAPFSFRSSISSTSSLDSIDEAKGKIRTEEEKSHRSLTSKLHSSTKAIKTAFVKQTKQVLNSREMRAAPYSMVVTSEV